MKLIKTLTAIALTGLSLSTLPALAEEMKEFRVGILGGENEADRLRNFACLQKHLGELFGIGTDNVKLFPAADYDGTVQGLLGGTLDYAELGASGYAKVFLADPKATEVILTTEQQDGSTGYVSVGVVRADSGINTIQDMKGKKLGFADPDSTSGYLIPLVELPKTVGDVKSFFTSTEFTGGHENCTLAVIDKKVDMCTTWASGIGNFDEGYTSGNLRKMVDKGVLNMRDLKEIWRSAMIPNGPVVVRSSLPSEVKQKFKDFMLKLHETDDACFQAIQGGDFKRLVEMNHDFYLPIIEARKAKLGGS
jgi:phosphonate transport system substrate-binding protein